MTNDFHGFAARYMKLFFVSVQVEGVWGRGWPDDHAGNQSGFPWDHQADLCPKLVPKIAK